MRLRLGRRLVNLLPLTQRTKKDEVSFAPFSPLHFHLSFFFFPFCTSLCLCLCLPFCFLTFCYLLLFLFLFLFASFFIFVFLGGLSAMNSLLFASSGVVSGGMSINACFFCFFVFLIFLPLFYYRGISSTPELVEHVLPATDHGLHCIESQCENNNKNNEQMAPTAEHRPLVVSSNLTSTIGQLFTFSPTD